MDSIKKFGWMEHNCGDNRDNRDSRESAAIADFAIVSFVSFVSFVSKNRLIHPRPNFLSEGVRFGAKSKLTRMGVYSAYIPIRGNELGAEDDPLSQQIICC